MNRRSHDSEGVHSIDNIHADLQDIVFSTRHSTRHLIYHEARSAPPAVFSIVDVSEYLLPLAKR